MAAGAPCASMCWLRLPGTRHLNGSARSSSYSTGEERCEMALSCPLEGRCFILELNQETPGNTFKCRITFTQAHQSHYSLLYVYQAHSCPYKTKISRKSNEAAWNARYHHGWKQQFRLATLTLTAKAEQQALRADVMLIASKTLRFLEFESRVRTTWERNERARLRPPVDGVVSADPRR